MALFYYGTEAEVQAACDKCWVNRLREHAEIGDGTLYVDPQNSNEKIAVSEASDSELVNLVILCRDKNGNLIRDRAFTYRWAAPMQCYDDDTKYFAPIHPDSQRQEGISCGTEEESENWYVPT